jgi:hypothetical protein
LKKLRIKYNPGVHNSASDGDKGGYHVQNLLFAVDKPSPGKLSQWITCQFLWINTPKVWIIGHKLWVTCVFGAIFPGKAVENCRQDVDNASKSVDTFAKKVDNCLKSVDKMLNSRGEVCHFRPFPWISSG